MELLGIKEGMLPFDRPCTLFWLSPDELVDCLVSHISIKKATLVFEGEPIPDGPFNVNISFEKVHITLSAKLLSWPTEGSKGLGTAKFIYKSWLEKRKMNSLMKLLRKKVPKNIHKR
jgi:hypothetical protein